jgi:peptidoglycan/xylan/chitin deacetylase (PgdA/CDA1 family)
MLAPLPSFHTRDPNCGPLPERAFNMASRFVARQSVARTLDLRGIPPLVTFTFDDVPASACEIGAPILERYDARATFYVAGAGCGTVNSDASPRASIAQLRTVRRAGHEIGCHTFSHAAVRYLGSRDIATELARNHTALSEIDDTLALRNFAYPYGDLSIRTKRYLEHRFDSCRSGHPGINIGMADLGALNAWPLNHQMLDRAKIGALIQKTVRHRGWLIFFGHDVAKQPSPYGITPEILDWTADTARREGCVMTTVARGLDLIRRSNHNE